jgi:hypothetical protein
MKTGKVKVNSSIAKSDDSSIGPDLITWNKFKNKIYESVNAGTIFSKEIVSTYSLVYTANTDGQYMGGVLAPNGDIHFIPFMVSVGQKVSSSGVVSTYPLVYTHVSGYAYHGGILAFILFLVEHL